MTLHPPSGPPLVVVGIDGSTASKDALRWALRYAAGTPCALRAVLVHHDASPDAWIPHVGDDPARAARHQLARTVERITGPDPATPVELAVVEGSPGPALVEASAGAVLLVVGSRGRSEWQGLLLGSVSQYCSTHARCPVVVVPHRTPVTV